MFKKRLIISFILMPLVFILLSKELVDYLFINKTSSSVFFYNQSEKVWGHRGYFKNQEENSINAFREAFNMGAKGTELDIYFDIELKDFVVSHDFPYNTKGAQLLMLADVFKAFDKDKYFWLDFKNLESMSEKEVQNSIVKMTALSNKYVLKKIIIESKNINNLNFYSKAGFNTSYWITFNENVGRLMYWRQVYSIKAKYIMGYFSAISMNHKNYTTKLKSSFLGLPVLLFTINDLPTVNKYLADDSVKVILSDEDHYDRKNNSTLR